MKINIFQRISSSIRAGFRKAAEVWSTSSGFVAGFFNLLGNGKASYQWLSRNGFKKNPIANRSIYLVAYQVAKIEIKVFFKDSQGKRVEHMNHPALDLLESPNPRQGRLLFFISLVAYLYLAGEVFVRVQKRQTSSSDAPAGEPIALWLLQPNRVRFIRGQNQEITGYRFTGRRGVPEDYDLDEVRHIRTFNPDDDERGYPLLGPAVDAIEEMLNASKHNKSLMKAGGRTPGFFISPDELGDKAFDRMKEELVEAYMEDSEEGRPGLLEGGLKFEANAQSNQELEFIEGKKESRKDIAASAGVDPALVGDAANKTYSNFETAIKALLKLTALPLLDFVLDELSPFLFAMYKDRPRRFFDYNEDDIAALEEDRNKKYLRLIAASGGAFLTPNQALKEAGFEESEEGAFNQVYRPFNLIPLASLEDAELSAEQRQRRKAAFAALRSLPPGELDMMLSVMLLDAGGAGGDGDILPPK